MYKRIALFSSDLFTNSLDNQYLRENVEKQIDKIYGDDFLDECPEHSEKYSVSLSSQNTTVGNTDYTEDNFLGKFKCILCPKKIIINEVDLYKHIKSKQHLSKVEDWKKKQESAKKIRDKFNKLHNLVTENDSPRDINSEDDEISDLGTTTQPIIKRKSKKRRKSSDLTEEQITARKIKFIRKKERRIARKSQLIKCLG